MPALRTQGFENRHTEEDDRRMGVVRPYSTMRLGQMLPTLTRPYYPTVSGV